MGGGRGWGWGWGGWGLGRRAALPQRLSGEGKESARRGGLLRANTRLQK
jgi:hypothetical protein